MFKVSFQKEIEDARKLADMIRQDNWVDSETIIVNCSPDYSSIMCQILNHELSKSNRHELLEQLPLEMPYPNMSQVWNRDTAEYEPFDYYLNNWVKNYVHNAYKYLFLDSGTIRGKNFAKVKSYMRKHTDHKFGTLYMHEDSIFKPDYVVETFNNTQGELIFEWENPKNPNW